jgi:hypothetical protein
MSAELLFAELLRRGDLGRQEQMLHGLFRLAFPVPRQFGVA